MYLASMCLVRGLNSIMNIKSLDQIISAGPFLLLFDLLG